MKVALTIAKYTIIEAFRDKFTWLIFLFMFAGIPLGLFIKALTLFGAETTYPTTVLTMVGLTAAVVSVIYVNFATRRELDGRIMHVILSKPVPNIAYLIGKHMGFCVVSTVYVVVGAIMLVVLGIATPLLAVQFAFGLILMQSIVVAASLFFALMLNSVTTSVVISIVAWAFFYSTQMLWVMAQRTPEIIVRVLGKVFYYLMPNYAMFDFKHEVLYGLQIPASKLAILPVQAVLYTAIILMFAWIDFSRKEY